MLNQSFKSGLSNKQQLQGHKGEERLKGKTGIGTTEVHF